MARTTRPAASVAPSFDAVDGYLLLFKVTTLAGLMTGNARGDMLAASSPAAKVKSG